MAYVLHCRNWVSLGSPDGLAGLRRTDRMLKLAEELDDRHMTLKRGCGAAPTIDQPG